MKKALKTQKGSAILVSILIISTVIMIIALSLGLSSITENQINMYQSVSNNVFLNMDGCAEEALIQLSRDHSYSSDSFTLDETSCTISVAGGGSARSITITANKDEFTKNLLINVSIFPTFTITAWDETT